MKQFTKLAIIMLVCWVSLFIILCESLNATPNSSLLERRNKFPGLVVIIPIQERLPRIINMPRVHQDDYINRLNQIGSDQEINNPSHLSVQRTFGVFNTKFRMSVGAFFVGLCTIILFMKNER